MKLLKLSMVFINRQTIRMLCSLHGGEDWVELAGRGLTSVNCTHSWVAAGCGAVGLQQWMAPHQAMLVGQQPDALMLIAPPAQAC
jgi:2-keto-3-deoxy-6-phosphogluconate aldolase